MCPLLTDEIKSVNLFRQKVLDFLFLNVMMPVQSSY